MTTQLTTERLREIAAGATLYGHERNAMAAELLAKREECASLWASGRALLDSSRKLLAERDAATRHRDDLICLYKRDCETMAATGIKETLLQDAIPALAAERDAARADSKKYHDALVARHGGEPVALLSELDEARAEAEKLRADLQAMTVEAMRAGRELAAVKRQRDAKDEALRWASELIRGQVTDTVSEVDGLRLGPNMVAAKIAEAIAASQPAQQPKPSDGDKCEGGHDAIGIAFTADDVWLCRECLDGCDVEPKP